MEPEFTIEEATYGTSERTKANEWWNSLTSDQKEGAVLLLNNKKLDHFPDSAYWTGRTVTNLYNQLKGQLS